MSPLNTSLLITAIVMGTAVASFPSKDKSKKNETPSFLQSDTINYDETTQIVTALGHVQIAQNNQLLYADEVSYNQLSDEVTAIGHVWLRDKEGNFLFTPKVTLKNKMADGFIDQIKVLMADDSRLAGNKGKRYNARKTILWQGVYSPCTVCKAKPEQFPTWQLKSDKVIHDQDKEVVEYHHAWLEMWGWPVFYMPYFSHPDPAVKRKSGFLMPIYSHSRDLGMSITTPYYWASGKNHDFTFYPTFTSNQGVIPAVEHRYRFRDGDYTMHGSYAHNTSRASAPNSNPNNYGRATRHRWHYFLSSRYEATPDVLLTFNVQRASDLTYLKRFPVLPRHSTDPFAASTALTSMAAAERFRPDSYGTIKSYVFQAERQKTVPVILPIIQYSYESLPGHYGETFLGDFNFLHLFRDRAITGQVAEKMVRSSVGVGGQIPYISPWGDMWTLRGYIRGDIYHTSGYQPTSTARPKDRYESRYFPQASLTWRYPFLNAMRSMHWILEPASMITTSSIGGNAIEIPNEDTPLVTIDTTNLFMPNRMYGIDRIDSGHRYVYGLNSRQLFSCARRFNLFFGQSIRLDRKQVLPVNSGEDTRASNFVTGLQVVPFSWLDLRSRTLHDRKNFSIEIAESSATVNAPWATGTLSHVLYDKKFTINNERVSQLAWNVSSGKYQGFSIAYGEMRNMVHRGTINVLNQTISVRHENECLKTSLSFIRTGFRDRDLRPDKRVVLQLDFKNLGTFYPININSIGGQRQAPVPDTASTRN